MLDQVKQVDGKVRNLADKSTTAATAACLLEPATFLRRGRSKLNVVFGASCGPVVGR